MGLWGAGKGGQAHLRAPAPEVAPAPFPALPHSIPSPCTPKPLDKQHLHPLEFVPVPFFCGLGSALPEGSPSWKIPWGV